MFYYFANSFLNLRVVTTLVEFKPCTDYWYRQLSCGGRDRLRPERCESGIGLEKKR